MINKLLELFLFSFACACLGHFFQLCIEPTMLLGRYGLWLEAVASKSWRKKDKWKKYILKPLGLCYKCTGFWIFTICWIIANIYMFNNSIGAEILLLFLGSGLNHMWQELLNRYIF